MSLDESLLAVAKVRGSGLPALGISTIQRELATTWISISGNTCLAKDYQMKSLLRQTTPVQSNFEGRNHYYVDKAA